MKGIWRAICYFGGPIYYLKFVTVLKESPQNKTFAPDALHELVEIKRGPSQICGMKKRPSTIKKVTRQSKRGSPKDIQFGYNFRSKYFVLSFIIVFDVLLNIRGLFEGT